VILLSVKIRQKCKVGNNPGNSLLYDITSLPSYGSAEILEYGNAKDHPELEQINLGMVMERSRNIPLFFEIYSRSIPDVVTLKRTVDGIRKLIPKMEIVLDRELLLLP
jgi:transposase